MLLCDLNCDMGEGIGNEEQLMPFISSANIACGFHAGDEPTMRKVVQLCKQYDVAIGAHPSYPDRESFGRRDLIYKELQLKDLHSIITEQLNLLQQIVSEEGASLHHVKLHGALYNRAAWDAEVAHFICQAIYAFNPKLVLYGLSGSHLAAIANDHNLKFYHEIFADRTYQNDGSLTPRTEPNALIQTDAEMLKQVKQLVLRKRVKSISGKWINLELQTICIHGDGVHAVPFAQQLHRLLYHPQKSAL